jgi:hypothetical protein
MSFALEPVDYLRMLKEEYGEYRRSSPELIRKAITCCSLSNAMPEIVFAEYGITEPQKVHGARSHGDYRVYLRGQCEAHHTVRDLCDFSKHGPTLRRATVSVQGVKSMVRQVGIWRGLLAITEIREIGRLEVTHQNGRTELMDDILRQVIASWDVIFPRDGL